MRASTIEKNVREAILDVITHFACLNRSLSEQQILQFLPVKSNQVAVHHHLLRLIKRGLVKQLRDGTFGLKNADYSIQKENQKQLGEKEKKARRYGKLIGLIPFVKSVVLICETTNDKVSQNSPINLAIVCLPSRIYLTKAKVRFLLSLLRQKATAEDSKSKFACNYYFSTTGLKFVKDVGKTDLQRVSWFMLARPVYGKKAWNDLLKKDSYLVSHLPNWIWPKASRRIYTSNVRLLDRLDDYGYKRFLRYSAKQKNYHGEGMLLRVRPDVMLQNSQQAENSSQLEACYKKLKK